MTRNRTATLVAGSVLLVGGMGTAALLTAGDNSGTSNQAGLFAPNALAPGETLAEGQYLGPCSVVTPPEPDPCEAAQLVLRYQFWAMAVNADQFKKWTRSAPLDFNRLKTLMVAPKCSTVLHPQPQIMVTKMGAALADVVEAYACALGTEPIVLPTPDPAPVGSDKIPPSAPQDLTVQTIG